MDLPPYIQSLERCPTVPGEAALGAACRDVAARLEEGALPCLAIAGRDDDLPALEARAAGIAADADDVILAGTGGSSLGARALAALAPPRPAGPRLHVLDNVDPDTWERVTGGLVPERTHLLAISKSGETLETVALSLLAADRLGAGRATAIAGKRGALRDAFEARGLPVLDHDPAIDGRYSVLSPTGLLPALIAGLDARAVRRGAAAALDDFRAKGPESPPARGAAMAVGLDRGRGRHIQVMMAYADRLVPFARWFVQLWAESLGKRGRGSMPVAASGTADQHSQLQFWIAGPPHCWVTVLGVETRGLGPAPDGEGVPGHLAGRTLGDVMFAEREATVRSLAEAGVPVRTFALEAPDERALGALFAHFMLETIVAGRLLDVDPFGQPAVEDGKRRAAAMLGAMAR